MVVGAEDATSAEKTNTYHDIGGYAAHVCRTGHRQGDEREKGGTHAHQNVGPEASWLPVEFSVQANCAAQQHG